MSGRAPLRGCLLSLSCGPGYLRVRSLPALLPPVCRVAHAVVLSTAAACRRLYVFCSTAQNRRSRPTSPGAGGDFAL